MYGLKAVPFREASFSAACLAAEVSFSRHVGRNYLFSAVSRAAEKVRHQARAAHCVVPSGLDLREILPGTPVPGYRLSRPFGTDCVG